MVNDYEHDASPNHIVKSTRDWNETSIRLWTIPLGVLCVELCNDGKTKIKIGDGKKVYRHLPYICDCDLSLYFTKEELCQYLNDQAYMRFRGIVTSERDLPNIQNKQNGDSAIVYTNEINLLYLYTNDSWKKIGVIPKDIDLTPYARITYVDEKVSELRNDISELQNELHFHDNKNILDAIEEAYTTAEKEKLASLSNFDATDINNRLSKVEKTAHTHDNKDILDKTTASFKVEDKENIDRLVQNDSIQDSRLDVLETKVHTHDNKDVLDQITQKNVDEWHTHKNKKILDKTTASFTTEYKYILDNLPEGQVYYDFKGSTSTTDGTSGLVPQPKRGEQTKYLRGDGTWATIDTPASIPATRTKLGSVIIGNNIDVDGNGVISVRFPDPTPQYELPVATDEILGGVIIGEGVNVDEDGTISVQEYEAGTGISFIQHSVPIVPSTLQAVEYIESSGSQYILLNMDDPISSTTRTRIVYEFSPSSGFSGWNNIVSGWHSDASNGRNIYTGYSEDHISSVINNGYGYLSSDITCEHETIVGNRYTIDTVFYERTVSLKINNEEIINGTTPDPPNCRLMLFASGYGDDYGIRGYGKEKLYSCKIYFDNVLTFDLIPAVRKSNNTPGLYDSVHDVFYTNQGSGEFTPGPNVESESDSSSDNNLISITNTGVLSVTQDSQNLNKIIVEYVDDSDEIIIPTYSLPTATASTLGGVKIGDGVDVDEDGVISVTQYQSGTAIEIISGESIDIPDTYRRVEYIQSDTTQYIDTGYTQRSGSCFRIEVCPLQDPNLQSTQQVIFGNYVTTYNTQSYQVCWYMNDQGIYQFTFGISNTRYPAYTYFTGYYDQDIVAHVYNNTIEIYDSNDEYLLITRTLNQSIGDGANTIAIFCKHVDDHYDSKSKIKLRRFSIYSQLNSQNEFDDQYLVMDMYPVVRISDNVAGLYDVITETFFSSPVGNDFIVGPDLYSDTRINVKYNDGLDVNSNNELINTGVLDVSLNQSDNTILDVEFADETKHIQLPSSGVQEKYTAGEGISIIRNTDDITIPVYYDNFETGDIDPSTGLNISIIGYDIIRTNDFTIFISDDDSVATTANIYDSDDASLLWKMFFYQGDGTFISATNNWNQNDDSITIPTNAKWIKLTVKRSDGSELVITDLGSCNIILSGDVKNVISIKKATTSTLGGVRVGDDLVIDNTGRLSVDPNLIQRIETMEEHDISDTDDMIIHVNS